MSFSESKINKKVDILAYLCTYEYKCEQRRFDKQAAKHHGFECLIPGVASMTL
jgi:hypothetical protein